MTTPTVGNTKLFEALTSNLPDYAKDSLILGVHLAQDNEQFFFGIYTLTAEEYAGLDYLNKQHATASVRADDGFNTLQTTDIRTFLHGLYTGNPQYFNVLAQPMRMYVMLEHAGEILLSQRDDVLSKELCRSVIRDLETLSFLMNKDQQNNKLQRALQLLGLFGNIDISDWPDAPDAAATFLLTQADNILKSSVQDRPDLDCLEAVFKRTSLSTV